MVIEWNLSIHPFFSNLFARPPVSSSLCCPFNPLSVLSVHHSPCPAPTHSSSVSSFLSPSSFVSLSATSSFSSSSFTLHTFPYSVAWQMYCAMASKLCARTHTHVLICTTKAGLQKQQHNTASRKHLLRTTTSQRFASSPSPWQQATTLSTVFTWALTPACFACEEPLDWSSSPALPNGVRTSSINYGGGTATH